MNTTTPSRGIRRKRRAEPDDEETTRTTALYRVAAIALAFVTVGSVLAIGAVHLPVLGLISAVTLGATVLAIHLRMHQPQRVTVPLAVTIALCLAGYSLVQAMPLPMGWLERIAPMNADIWARVLLPFEEPAPHYVSMSLDPGASVVEALRWATYAGVFFVAAIVANRRGGAFGIAVVFASAFAAALTTLAHGLSGASKVFGLYQPQFAVAPWHIGPLLNPNNLSGYLNLGAFCGVGLFMMRRPILPRWLVGLGVTTILAIGATSASRAGLGVLPIGIAVFSVLLWKRSDRRDVRETSPTFLKAMLAVALGAGISLAILGSTHLTWLEASDRDISKLDLFRSLEPMLRDHPWVGVGRGAFESTYPVYRTTPGNIVFTHAENFVLQWASEWGIPVTLLAIAAFAVAFRPNQLGVRRSAVAIGGWTGVVVLLGHNLVDLAFEVPAVCIAAAVVVGSLAGDVNRRGARVHHQVIQSGSWWRMVIVGGAGIVVLCAAFRWGWHDIASDRMAIRALLETINNPMEREKLKPELRKAMLRHPGEPYFALVGALSAWQGQTESPVPWLQRCLERSKRNGRAHLLLAEVLDAHDAMGQALLELRFAIEDDNELVTAAVRTALRWTRSYEELIKVVPEGKLGARVLTTLAQNLYRSGEEDVRLQCAREATLRDSSAVQAHWAVADVLLHAIETNIPKEICLDSRRAACVEEAETRAKAIASMDPNSYYAPAIKARLLLLDGRAAAAEELLSHACNRVKDRPSCLRLRVAAASQTTEARFATAVKDLSNAACNGAIQCAEVATWLGDLMVTKKAWGQAVTHYERAVSIEPTVARWMRLGQAASVAGAHVRAVEAYTQALKLHDGDNTEIKTRIDEARARAVSGTLIEPPIH